MKTMIVACLLLVVPLAFAGPDKTAARRVDIKVTAAGYQPAQVTAQAGEKLILVFTRKGDAGCGNTVVVPAVHFHADLEDGKPVEVSVTMPQKGEIKFACGMDMMKGQVVVK